MRSAKGPLVGKGSRTVATLVVVRSLVIHWRLVLHFCTSQNGLLEYDVVREGGDVTVLLSVDGVGLRGPKVAEDGRG